VCGAGVISGGLAWLARVVGATTLLGLSVGLGACGDPPYYDSEAFFANTTRQSVNVRVLELSAAVDCESVSGSACERLTESAFAFERMYAVAPGQALPLEYEEEAWRSGGVGGTTGGGTSRTPSGEAACGAAVVQIVGLPSTCVFWKAEGGTSSEQRASVADAAFRRRSIRLEGTKGLHRLATGAGLESGTLLSTPAGEPTRLLGFSGRAAAQNNVIETVTELPDGCLAIGHRVLNTTGTTPSTIYLCAPRSAFPFAVGSQVSISISSERLGGEFLTITEFGGTFPRRLELFMNARTENRQSDPTFAPLEGGHVTRCGAYVENLGLETLTGVLAAGEMTETTLNGVRTRTLLGRAERVVVAPSTCETARATLGIRYDLLTVVSPETDP
jgi:hypothetical protein